jgi:EAL domain-containing protein (putative c-di-GMP-specific phosphodiesterase class I)
VAALEAQSGTAWNPALIDVLKKAEPRCRDVYEKYIHYTMALPKTISLVEKRQDRPMGLKFRPMMSDAKGTVVAYEATAWFGAIANQPGETETMTELSAMLKRTNLVENVTEYFLYEAADAVVRIANCKLPIQYLVLEMLPDFYSTTSQLQRIQQVFKNQQIQGSQLLLTIPESTVMEAGKGATEIIQRYLRNGVCLVMDDFHPERWSVTRLKEYGFQYLRLSAELNLQQSAVAAMKSLQEAGFQMLGAGADTPVIQAWLAANGVSAMSGTMTGIPVSEDEMIRDCLLRERKA